MTKRMTYNNPILDSLQSGVRSSNCRYPLKAFPDVVHLHLVGGAEVDGDDPVALHDLLDGSHLESVHHIIFRHQRIINQE